MACALHSHSWCSFLVWPRTCEHNMTFPLLALHACARFISQHLLFMQAFPSRMAELPVQICAGGAVRGCATVHAVAPASLLWQIRPRNPASQVPVFCLPISLLNTCLLSCYPTSCATSICCCQDCCPQPDAQGTGRLFCVRCLVSQSMCPAVIMLLTG